MIWIYRPSIDTRLGFTLTFVAELMRNQRFTFGFFAYREFTSRRGRAVCAVGVGL
jgi:hypothetical protein